MLALVEIENTLEIEYELQLESLGEQALRDLMAELPARRLPPNRPRRRVSVERLGPDLRTVAWWCAAQIVARDAQLVSNGPLLSSGADFFLAASQTKEELCRCTCMNAPERERNKFR
ncbi:hypothetical protein [Piscinibacter sp.]|jgi:hypothetical protein|uniref:hypothetical protein n=1 Tax=Piscinibacter sp. TaxID=1903157 RepID=UPI0035597E2C